VFFRLSSRWIGFSLIAIFEILDLIYQLIYLSCGKQQQQKTRVQPAVEVAVIDLSGKSSYTKNNLETAQPTDKMYW